MAQTVSELWSTLWGLKNTEREYAFDINGVWYGADSEVEHKVESSLYSEFGIGNATTSTLSLSLFADNIPRAAQIKRYVRLVNGNQVSEWLPKGIFWANRRSADNGYWTIEAFDAMRKADIIWEPDQSLEFPMAMTDAVDIIANLMGVNVDPRTNINSSYTIDYPVSEQTLRKTLQWIAAANGGNFHITGEGKLLFVSLISAQSETNYLVTEDGSPIVFGGVKILVDDAGTSGISNEEGSKFFVGLDIVDFVNNGKYKPVSRVTLLLDNENSLTAGDDTGLELVADCPYASEIMVDSLLDQFKGYEYQSYEADEVNIDPSAELGDGVTVSGIYAVIGRIVDDGTGYHSISAPGEAALDDEYPDIGPMQQEFSLKIAEARSLIAKTAEEIKLSVEGVDGRVSALSVTLDGVTITGEDGQTLIKGSSIDTSTIKANSITVDKLYLTDSISWDDLASDAQNQVTNAQNVASSAYSLASSANNTVSGWVYPGSTYINGNMLMTGTVKASQLLGGYVGLLNANQQTVGQIAIGASSSGNYAIELNSTGGGLRLSASADFWVDAAYGSMGITSSGIVCRANTVPGSSGNYSLGASGLLWSSIYAATGTIITSDQTKKNSIGHDLDIYSKLFDHLLPVSYKLNNSTSNRTHIGFISQDVEESMKMVGLDSLDFAGFIKSPKVDENGNEIEGEYDYALRYEEFIPINTMEIQKLKARVAELENKINGV